MITFMFGELVLVRGTYLYICMHICVCVQSCIFVQRSIVPYDKSVLAEPRVDQQLRRFVAPLSYPHWSFSPRSFVSSSAPISKRLDSIPFIRPPHVFAPKRGAAAGSSLKAISTKFQSLPSSVEMQQRSSSAASSSLSASQSSFSDQEVADCDLDLYLSSIVAGGCRMPDICETIGSCVWQAMQGWELQLDRQTREKVEKYKNRSGLKFNRFVCKLGQMVKPKDNPWSVANILRQYRRVSGEKQTGV